MGAGDPRWLVWAERILRKAREWLDRYRRRRG